MNNQFVQRLAEQLQLPVPVVEEVASAVAERCALVANRYEPEGIFTMDQLSAVETVGSQIGAVIIQSFPVNDHAR